jgi:hypothetical protein
MAVTAAVPPSVNVHVLALLPPLEHAPDQIASRPLVTLNVIDVPVLNDDEPVLPTFTLIPPGLESTRSPLRPDALTVRVAGCDGGVTVKTAVFVTPSSVAEIVTDVDAETFDVAMVKVALAVPAGMVTLSGTVATALLLLESEISAPPIGAAAVSITVPIALEPPTTAAEFIATADKVGALGVDPCGVNRRVAENGPKTPAASCARTRHHSSRTGRSVSVTVGAVTVGFATKGADIACVSSTCTS